MPSILALGRQKQLDLYVFESLVHIASSRPACLKRGPDEEVVRCDKAGICNKSSKQEQVTSGIVLESTMIMKTV